MADRHDYLFSDEGNEIAAELDAEMLRTSEEAANAKTHWEAAHFQSKRDGLLAAWAIVTKVCTARAKAQQASAPGEKR